MAAEQFIFINNAFIPAAVASLQVGDLAIQRGFGMFDFFKTIGHAPVFLDAHLDRFFHSAQRLRLPLQHDRVQLKQIIHTLLEKNNTPDCGVKMIVTGGYSPDGYTLAAPNFIISQSPLSALVSAELSKPIKLVTYAHQRQMPDIKTIDYLMAIWLQPHIAQHGADDVLYHHEGVLSECPRANFFIVTEQDELITPSQHILKGVIRSQVLAQTKFKATARELTLDDLVTAKEAFITSTTKHVLPVTHIDGKVIGNGKAGPVAAWLQQDVYARALASR